MNTNKNLPRVLYFAIQNSQGKIVYTLQCHKKYFFKVAVDIPDNFLTPPSDDTNYSIVWSINDEVIQHDDIPVLLMKQENKHILLFTCEVTADEEKMIYLNLSLRAAHSEISPKSQLKTFSFLRPSYVLSLKLNIVPTQSELEKFQLAIKLQKKK